MAGAPLGEFGRIHRYFAPLARAEGRGLRDDAAFVPPSIGEDMVATLDTMVEGVHFLSLDPADLVARKLLRVNLSDLAAKGAVPFGYLLSLALPTRCDDGWVERFAAGLEQDQRTYDWGLLGGDSVSTPGPITLSVTALGRVAAGRAIHREGGQAGDRVWVSGTLGDGALGLTAATGGLSQIDPGDRAWLIDRYRLPQPRILLGPRLIGIARAMMDVSDGLVQDLGHLAEASGVGAVIAAADLPLSAAARRVDPAAARLAALTGGDDYELLFAAPPEAEASVRAAALSAGVAVTPIGTLIRGSGVVVTDESGQPIPLARTGWVHG